LFKSASVTTARIKFQILHTNGRTEFILGEGQGCFNYWWKSWLGISGKIQADCKEKHNKAHLYIVLECDIIIWFPRAYLC